MSKRDPNTTWRAPTRRAFVAMLGAAATALAVERSVRQALRANDDVDRPRTATRWIGHC
jgi:hypothetical protein